MCRRPLLPLLALAALLALLPSCHALSCYRCIGSPSRLSGANPASFNRSGVTSLYISDESKTGDYDIFCDNFDPSLEKYKLNCPSGFRKGCVKNVLDGEVMQRGCANLAGDQCTEFDNDFTQCLCTDDYCNSAGLTAPALLLLLPAALLAFFSSRQ